MRKLFVEPAVSSIELFPANGVMSDILTVSLEADSTVQLSPGFADSQSAEYKRWRGRN